jgi:hypothetical protein
MGAQQCWGGRDAGKSWVDGVEVTSENYEALVARNVKRRSIDILKEAHSQIAYLWSGKTVVPEREQIAQILAEVISRLEAEL